jgi:hypothetical protein
MVDENVMIDLETLGTESDAVILSIGAVWFDRYNVDEGEGYYATLNWQDQLDRGGDCHGGDSAVLVEPEPPGPRRDTQ